jgi:hypothetical protein
MIATTEEWQVSYITLPAFSENGHSKNSFEAMRIIYTSAINGYRIILTIWTICAQNHHDIILHLAVILYGNMATLFLIFEKDTSLATFFFL